MAQTDLVEIALRETKPLEFPRGGCLSLQPAVPAHLFQATLRFASLVPGPVGGRGLGAGLRGTERPASPGKREHAGRVGPYAELQRL